MIHCMESPVQISKATDENMDRKLLLVVCELE